MRMTGIVGAGLCSLVLLSASATALDESFNGSGSGAPVDAAAGAHSAPELGQADLETWLDGLIPYSLQTGDVAGAVVVVVKDGQVLLQKGYGYADVAAKKPVDPQRTLFRAGSVAKLVTDTAVMQQVELGKLDLDADINTYLDFRVPDAFGKPVTLRNLMNHTAGFEELLRGLMQSDPKAYKGIDEYLRETKPVRMFPPGEAPSYCNYCLTLAAYIVQRVSGEAFDDYLDRRIFQPLNMQRSTFRQPLPDQFAGEMSKGYSVASSEPRYYELAGPAPAGSLAITGADMARFMIAHLQVESGGSTLLRPETARLMHTSMFRAAPPTQGNSLGFFERNRNGRRIIGHGGDTQYFHSDLLLFPDDNVGLFMSFNSAGRNGAVYRLRSALFEMFTDRYFPAPAPQEPTTATAVEHAREVAGLYASSRRAKTSFSAVVTLLGQARVVAKDDGTLVIPELTGLNGQPKVWREVAPYVWREVGGQERLAAKIENGRVRFLGFDEAGGIEVLQPVSLMESSAWILPALVVAIAVLLLTVIYWPVAALIRRRYGAAFALVGRQALAYRLARVAAIVSLVFLLGWALIIQTGMSDLAAFGGRMDGWIMLFQLLGLVGLIGAGVAIWNAWLAWRGSAKWWSKAWSVALATACVLIVWFGFAFNLIGVRLHY
jgi:CubicO group peptidase (beta-lactamase class C family)